MRDSACSNWLDRGFCLTDHTKGFFLADTDKGFCLTCLANIKIEIEIHFYRALTLFYP